MLIHYGWDCSPYSAKTRSYLRFKGIAHEDRHPNVFVLQRTIRKAVGRSVMPTVLRPDGTWMQDTSEIIDALEAEHPRPTIVPPSPVQRLASLLLELHADEWLPTVIMHTRWNYPASAAFAVEEFAREGLPFAPRFLGKPVVASLGRAMSEYRPKLGVHGATTPGIESFAKGLISRLEAHFAAHDYLLGGRPCLGDFALFGPLWAHVWRDPATRHWFAAAPHVVEWFDRMQDPGEPGEWVDGVPETLDAVFATMFEEQWVFLRSLVGAIDAWAEEHPDATRVPRALGDHDMTIGGCVGPRRLITFTQWMLQRPLDEYLALGGEDRASADRWLARVGGTEAMTLRVTHRMVRRDFREFLEAPPRTRGGAVGGPAVP